MKAKLLIVILFTQSAFSSELCDVLENPAITNITSLGIQNCIDENKLFDESENPGSGPICRNCRNTNSPLISMSDNDRKKLKQEAFVKEMASEFQKAMATLLLDLAALRKMNSTNASFSESIDKCSSASLNSKLSSCGETQKNILAEMRFDQMIPNEIANLLSKNPSDLGGLLTRDSKKNECSISDEEISQLAPLVLEKHINPDFVNRIASVEIATMDEIFDAVGPESIGQLKAHPILMALGKDPAKLIKFFKDLKGVPSQQLSSRFKAELYTSENGQLLDQDISNKCEQAINNFTKICSPQVDQGKISLGPFNNFARFNNDDFPIPNPEYASTTSLLTRNLTMLEFCDAPSPGDLQIPRDTIAINNFLPENLRNKTYRQFDSEVYYRSVGTLKINLCKISKGARCESTFECQLSDFYKKTLVPNSPEYRLANSADTGINSILRSMVGNNANLSPTTKTVLIAEGILPQTNGQFVDRPTPPERQPEYLANVASGTITPNTSSAIAGNSTSTSNNRPNRPQGAQPALAQPNPQAATASADTQLAAASTDDEDMDRFQAGLDARLRRAEGITDPTQTQLQSQLNRPRTTSVNSGRPQIRQGGSFIPTNAVVPAQADSVIPQFIAPGVPSAPDASLAPDASRQNRAERQASEARAQMLGARTNPAASGEAGRSPASVEGSNPADSIVALTISGDISANLEQVLRGLDTRGSDLRSLIEARRPFKFQLNNSLFDVRIKNGVYQVVYRSGDENQRSLASTLQTLFNNSITAVEFGTGRSATLGALRESVRP